MSETVPHQHQNSLKAVAVAAAFALLYITVLTKLGRDWWSDENYSHGLLVPVVIGIIAWLEWDALRSQVSKPAGRLGGGLVVFATLMLFAGTLGAELFTQRISMVVMLAGLAVYLFGVRVLKLLAVPLALLVLAIPIPQIIFNRIAFPLQIWASQMAVWGIRLFEVPTVRKGNVIDILPQGATQTISLEVVEACSGIRSLMTLATLALVLAYFTRCAEGRGQSNLGARDWVRAILLMGCAVPIAVLTNAARVAATGVLTFYYGKQATDTTLHDLSGWLVYVVAFALLAGANVILIRILRRPTEPQVIAPAAPVDNRGWVLVLPLVALLVVSGGFINWFAGRSEAPVQRASLADLPVTLGNWRQKGSEIRFDEQVESVLRTTDYTMREYMMPDGRIANLYVGYYASQRTGATYHSPQNCLPGAGWVMHDPQQIDIKTPDGRTFSANRYIIENGVYKEAMIYWYQGRGHTEASEYTDKVNTIWDSVTRRRSDGAIIRVMTDVGTDEESAINAAADLAARLAENLSPFVPE